MSNHLLMQMFSLRESLIYYINALHSNGANVGGGLLPKAVCQLQIS